jgi:1-acyl-sn-glycerol-3-phosphate acyltransferase
VRGLIDRLVAFIARVAARASFRRMEVVGFDDLARDAPVLLVANHFNGFVDPVVLVAAYGRLPRFLAKSTLWKVLPARPLLAFAGVIPVHRRVDGAADDANRSTFASAERALADRATVAIFPEGTTHDLPRLVELRTGAARIALGARARGVRGLVIVPVGLTYDDKVGLRSRVLVRAGAPIALDDEMPAPAGDDPGDADHEAVRRLTDLIRDRLQAVAPDYDSLLEEAALSRAADVRLRNETMRPQQEVPLRSRSELASQLADVPAPARAALVDELARYQLSLSLLHMTDAEVMPRATARTLVTRLVWLGVLVVVLAPFAVAGVLINALPTLIVAIAGALVSVPVTKGTVRLLVGLIVFPATWIALAWFDVGGAAIETVVATVTFPLTPFIEGVWGTRGGWAPSLLVFLTAPLFGFLAVWLLERITGWLRLWSGWHAVVNRRGQLARVLEQRADLVRDLDASLAPAALPVART